MKLGVFINQAFYSYDGQISTDLSFVRFIESFKESFLEIKVFAPTKNITLTEKQGLYSCIGDVSLCPLPYYQNVKDLIKNTHIVLPITIKKLMHEFKTIDRLWIVGPHPLGVFAGYFTKKYKVKCFQHIRGNILNDVEARYNNSLIGKIYAQYMHWSNFYLSKKMPTLTVGSELFNLYKNKAKKISWISPSLISDEDIKITKQTLNKSFPKNNRSIQILFVGRVEPEKGLTYLFKALRDLNKNSDHKYELTIVGSAQRGSEHREIEIKNMANEIGIKELIQWKGYKPYGDELKKIYRNKDIFILPSLAEGIPKVIYEAMAFGIPIISTDVGGISDIIKNNENGILIKPRSIDAIVSTIKLISENIELRNKLIENALSDAMAYTIETAKERILAAMDLN